MGTRSQDGSSTVAITVAVILAAAVGLGAAWWVAQPDRSIGAYERLGAEIGCVCGTCPYRPIATCGCGFADRMLVELGELVDQGRGDEEIMNTFVARYSSAVRIKPQGRGLDLTAWAVPMMLLSVGAVLLGAVVLRWARRGGGEPVAGTHSSAGADREPVDAASEERLRARVDRELRDLEP